MQWEDWKEKKGSIIVARGQARLLAEKYKPREDATLLDIGSGNGFFIDQLPQQTFKIIAADLDNFLSENSKKQIQKFITLNMDTPWHIPDASVDMITNWNVLEHAENPAHFMREAHRVLSPGGVLIISMPNIFNLKNRLTFLRTGEMHRFLAKNSHLSILTGAVFKKLYKMLFDLVEIGYAGLELPEMMQWFRPRSILPINRLTAHTVYYVFKKKA